MGSIALAASVLTPGAGGVAVRMVEGVRTDPTPAVFVDTIARHGDTYGIQVGDRFYPNPHQGAWAHLVVLDRETLAPIHDAELRNKAFSCSSDNPDTIKNLCVDRLRNDLRRLNASDLVIVSNEPSASAGAQAPRELRTALDVIGVPPARSQSNLRPGAFSAIGVPGLHEAHWHEALTAEGADSSGRMRAWPVRELRTSPREVKVDPPPSVTIDTEARGGTGVAIEGPTHEFNAFYPGTPGKWLHVVVLNREDLALVSNTSYDCPQADEHPYPSEVGELKPCIDKVRDALAKLENRDHTNLVIATSQSNGLFHDQPPIGMFNALGPSLGVRPWDWWGPKTGVFRGTYSAVGIPGQLNLASEKIGGQLARGSGRLIDNLVRDNEGSYGLVPGQHVAFDTQASGSDVHTNVIQIGDQRFGYRTERSDLRGIELVIEDAQTLEGKSYFFSIIGNSKGWAEMADTLRAVNDAAGGPFARRKLVFVATRGPLRCFCGGEAEKDVVRVADQLTTDGGTRTRFMDAVWHHDQNHPDSYTLVGETKSGTGRGLEAVGGPKSGTDLNTVPLTGTLARTGPYYDFTTQSADNAFSQTARGDVFAGAAQLLQTVGRTHGAWPEQGNPGRTAAIEYLGEKVLGTKDPRGQYWTIPWSASKWETISAEIAKQSYPATTAFGAEDFRWAKTELQHEIEWLNTEHEYLDERARPFSHSTLKSWAELQAIASEIDNEVKAPDRTTEARAAAITEFALDLGEELPLLGKAIAAEAAMYRLAIEYSTIDGEPVEEPFAVKAADAGKALVERMTAAEHYLSVDVPEVVASDYQKLKIVGSCGSPLAKEQTACPFKASDWQYTSLEQEHAAAGLLRGSKVAAYGALLPAKYKAWQLPPGKHKEANKNFAGVTFPFFGLDCHYPFADEPERGQVAIPKSAFQDGDYQITALGYLTGEGTITDRWKMHVPLASVTNPLFGTGSSELEINKEEFFSRFFPSPNTNLHYPERDTTTGWAPAPGRLASCG